MNKVLSDLLADDDQDVSVLLEPPRVNRLIPSRPAYGLWVRSLKPLWSAERLAPPEVVLENGERIPVTQTGSAMISGNEEAIASGAAMADDQLLLIRLEDLAPAQAEQARWFIQRRIDPDPSHGNKAATDWPPRIRPFVGAVIGGAPRYWPNDPTTVTIIVRRRDNSGTLITGTAQAITATGARRNIAIDSIPISQSSGDASRAFWRHAEVLGLTGVTLEEASAFVTIVQTHANDGELIYPRR